MFHPSDLTLSCFTDGELTGYARKRVARHLAKCDRCRRIVGQNRDISRQTEDLKDVKPSPRLRKRVLASVAAGEQVILPGEDWQPTPKRKSKVVLATVAVVVLAVAVFQVVTVQELSSDMSELIFEPARPEAGATIHVTYRATARLAGNERLRLRARYRKPGDESYNIRTAHIEVGDLRKTGSRTFEGRFDFPEDVVYAVFAVENYQASVVDSRGRRGWDLMIHSGDRPVLEAFDQKMRDIIGWGWDHGHQTAIEMTEWYPDWPGAWYYRFVMEQALHGQASHDSIRTEYLPILQRLHSLYRSQILESKIVEEMAWLASSIRDSAVTDFCESRMLQENPTGLLATQLRVVRLFRGSIRSQDISDTLEYLEGLWQESSDPPELLASMGMRFADRFDDSSSLARWCSRMLELTPEYPYIAINQAMRKPHLLDSALVWLEREVARLEDPELDRRQLNHSREEHARHEAEQLRTHYSHIGQVLFEKGLSAEAMHYLDAAVSDGWDLEVFRRVADIRYALGDEVGALEMNARVAADPVTQNKEPPSYFSGTPSEWERLIAHQLEAMTDLTLEQSIRKRPFGDVIVGGSTGENVSLVSLLHGHPTAIVLLDKIGPTMLRRITDLNNTLSKLHDQNWRLLVVARMPPDTQIATELIQGEVSDLVFLDQDGSSRTAFDLWKTTEYFVMDGDGFIRYQFSDLSQIPRQVLSLQVEATSKSHQLVAP